MVVFGGLVVSVLPTGPKVRGFKPGRQQSIFRGENIRSTSSLGEGVKPSAPCRNPLRHVKNPFEVWKRHFVRQNTSFPTQVSPALLLLARLPKSSGGRIRSFLCQYHSTVVLHSHTSPGGWTASPSKAAVQRRSVVPSIWSSTLQMALKHRN
jgi:hypothetical protein